MNSIDYRLLHAMGMDHYYSPAGDPEVTASLDEMWNSLTNDNPGEFKIVTVAQGRTIPCNKTFKNIAEFTFDELCDDARGSTDYMAIA